MHRTHVFAKLVLVVGLLLAPGLPARAGGYEAERQLQQSLVLVRAGVARLQAGDLDQAGAALEVARIKGLGATLRAAHARLQERFQLRQLQLQQMSVLAADRNQAMVRDYNQVVEELLASLDGLSPEDGVDPDSLTVLSSLAGRIAPPAPRPIFGALPYRHLGLARREPVTGPWLTPAYLGGPAAPHAEDTQATPEAPRSQAIVDKAESLGWSPARIYAFVEQDVETEWYHGCMKGAEETLRQGSGNDCDQASLLVALLRASGYPARYVRGVVEVHGGLPKLQELLGVNDGAQAAAFLQKAGIPYRTRIAGGRIAGIELEHLWVETRVPYANYRGVVADEQGKVWLGLAPAIKASGFETTAGAPLPDGVDLFLSRDDYLETARPETLLQYLQAEIEVAAALAGQALEYADVLRTRTRRPSAGGYLPASLPIDVVGVSHELTALPAELLHRVRVTARTSAGAVLFAEDLPLMDVSNRMLAVGFEPERVEDQQIINMHGGLNYTPAYLVRLRPVLRLGGERLAVAGDGLAMGEGFRVEVEVQGTQGLVERFEDEALAGNLLVLGVVGQRAVLPAALPLGEKNGERLLWEVAEDYVGRWNQAEDELARLVGVALARPLATVVAVGGVVEVTRVLDAPHGYEWRGVYVDADLRAVEVAAPEADRVTFMRLASLEGSVLEDRVLADAFGVESISTVKLIGLVQGGQGTLLGITQANAAQVVPGLPFDENVKADILDAVGQGLAVSVPDLPQTFVDWSGVGWLKESPETGEAGWMLSGMVAGGSTANDEISDEILQALLSQEGIQPNEDPSAVRYLAVLPESRDQQVVVGELADITVIALDQHYVPVQGVVVTFENKSSCGQIAGAGSPTTDWRGAAKTTIRTSLNTGCSATLRLKAAGDAYPQQVGFHSFEARAQGSTGRVVSSRAVVVAFPGVFHHLAKRPDQQGTFDQNELEFAGCLWALAADEHENPIANQEVLFSIDPVAPQVGAACGDRPPKPSFLVPQESACASPRPVLYDECSDGTPQLLALTTPDGAQACVFVGALGVDPSLSILAGYHNLQPVRAEAQGSSLLFEIRTHWWDALDYGFPNWLLGLLTTHPADPGRRADGLFGRAGETLVFDARLFLREAGLCTCAGTPDADGKLLLSPCPDGSGDPGEEPPRSRLTFARPEDCPGCVPVCVENSYTTHTEFLFSWRPDLADGLDPVAFPRIADHDAMGRCSTKMWLSAWVPDEAALLGGSWEARGQCDPVFSGVDLLMDFKGYFKVSLPLARGVNSYKLAVEPCIRGPYCGGRPGPIPFNGMYGYEEVLQATGVDFEFDRRSYLARVDEVGRTVTDVPIRYQIFPEEFRPLSVIFVIEQDVDGAFQPIQSIPGGQEQNGTVTIHRGTVLSADARYRVRLVLNFGRPDELWSDPVPLEVHGEPLVADRTPFLLERKHHNAEFDPNDPGVPDAPPFTDDFKIIPFHLLEPAEVSIRILDAEHNVAAVLVDHRPFPNEEMPDATDLATVVDYEAVRQAGVPTSEFFVQIEASMDSGTRKSAVVIPGYLTETRQGFMLGTLVAHDVRIADGALVLSREDFKLEGRGPALEFIRSYSNLGPIRGDGALGGGWSHNYDKRVNALSSESMGGGAVPQWVVGLKGLGVFNPGAVPSTQPESWTQVAVNGAQFRRKADGTWYSERGRHGQLLEEGDEYVFVALDGTRYHFGIPAQFPYAEFPSARLDPEALGGVCQDPSRLRRIVDRNGNTQTLIYDGQCQVKEVEDAVGRKLKFFYKEVRSNLYGTLSVLDRVELFDGTAQEGVLVERFEYNDQGYLSRVVRDVEFNGVPEPAWSEAYEYAREKATNAIDYNMVATVDAKGNRQQVAYHLPGETGYQGTLYGAEFKDEEVVKTVTYPGEPASLARFEYGFAASTRVVHDLRGNPTSYTLNDYGNPIRVEEPAVDGHALVTTLEWSIDRGGVGNDLVKRSVQNFVGGVEQVRVTEFGYAYNPDTWLYTETDANGKAATTLWNRHFNAPLETTDRNGVTQTWEYDAKGNLLEHAVADSTTVFEYNALGEKVAELRLGNSTPTVFTYDRYGLPAAVAAPEGSTRQYVHDLWGRLVSETDPHGNVTLYRYDSIGRLREVESQPADPGALTPDPPVPQRLYLTRYFGYDAVGNKVSETDRNGLELRYTYPTEPGRDGPALG